MAFAPHPLWISLQKLPLDDPAHAVPFSTRLRSEQGWSRDFTTRVLDEYRRFLFLTATRGELTVPSEAVDQAWHLHMIDTRAYWDELCGRVTGRAIHHTPSRGGAAEDVRHADAYEDTLRVYRETFGEEAPPDIWPCARERFAGRHRRVDTREAWIVPKRIVSRGAIAASAMSVLAGCAKASSSAVAALVIAVLVAGMFALITWAARQARAKHEGSGGGGGCGGIAGGCGGGHCGDGGSGCGSGGCGGGCG